MAPWPLPLLRSDGPYPLPGSVDYDLVPGAWCLMAVGLHLAIYDAALAPAAYAVLPGNTGILFTLFSSALLALLATLSSIML